MTEWYSNLTSDPDDLSPVADAYEYYAEQYEEAVKELNQVMKKGGLIQEAGRKIPGITGYRFAQLQEMEQILSFLENRETLLIGQKRRLYREHYQRELTDSMVEKYAQSDPEVIELAEIRNMFCLVRNKYLGLTKALESAHFQIGHLTKLAEANLDGSLMR